MAYKQYKYTPRAKFIQARAQAKYRNEEWDFTFEQWIALWMTSSKWENKGNGPNQYKMYRLDASKPWRKDNVVITNKKSSYRALNQVKPIDRTPIKRGTGHASKCRAVVCEGKQFDSVRAAIDHYDKYAQWLRDRLNSTKYPDWYYQDTK